MDEEKLAECIKNDDYDEIEQMVTSVLDKAVTRYKRGLRTYADLKSSFINELWEIRWYNALSALETNFVFDSTRIMFDEFAAWLRMRDDRRLFDAGKIPDSKIGNSWLQTHNNMEAPPEIKIKFFRLTDILHIPVFIWEKPNPSIKEYKKRVNHLYGTGIRWFICSELKEDGGFWGSEHPKEKKYIFIDKDDCEFHFEIKKLVENSCGNYEYTGFGHIVGYTSDVDREVSGQLSKNGYILCVYSTKAVNDIDQSYHPEEDDRWKEYFVWANEKSKRLENYMQACINEMLEKE